MVMMQTSQVVPSQCREFDCRSKGYIPKFRNQRNVNVCLPLCATEALEVMTLIHRGRQLLLSEQVFIDGYFSTYPHPKQKVYLPQFLKHINDRPMITSPDNYPVVKDYLCEPFEPTKILAPKVGAKWMKVELGVHKNFEEAMMAAVDEHGAILGCMRMSRDLIDYDGHVYEEHIAGRLNHAVLIIAYNGQGEGRHWTLQQNYGTNWGCNGFMKILRGRNLCGIETQAFYPIPSKDNVYESFEVC